MIQPKKPLVIAIDGHSSCGKSSFAKKIAKELGYVFIDSGAMYRAVTLYAMQNKLLTNGVVAEKNLENALSSIHIDFKYNAKETRSETYLNGENVEEQIRTLDVSNNVSEISKIKAVREHLVALQQKMGDSKKIIMDGRDIGTVVFPNADIKLFMTASIEVRAQRRYKELQKKGISGTLDEVAQNLSKRDEIDQNRAESPLKKAVDAIVLDNSNMTFDDQMVWFEKIIAKL